MTPCRFQTVALLPLAALAFLTACSSQGPPVRTSEQPKDSTPAISKAESAGRDTVRSQWIAILDHGDKPGNAYELFVSDQSIVQGKFHLLDPRMPLDLESAGQSVAIEDIKHTGKELTFSITLATGDGKYHDTLTIILLDNLVGKVGHKVGAKVQSSQPNTVSQELTFVRCQ